MSEFGERLAALMTEWTAFGRPAMQARGERRPWYRIENASDGSTDVHIMDEIGGWGVTASEFRAQLGEVKTPRLALHINSNGGDVFEGLAIYEMLQARGGVDVYVTSLAASIASVIALAGETISIAPSAMMMIHEASAYAGGDEAAHVKLGGLLGKVSDMIAGTYAQRTETPRESWRAAMLAESWYTAEEAVAAGLADKVAGVGTPVNVASLESFRFKGRQAAPAPVAIRPATEQTQPVSHEDPFAWFEGFEKDPFGWYDPSGFAKEGSK